MFSIIEKSTGKFLFSSMYNEVNEDKAPIEKICEIDNPENKDIYFNFETEQFYFKEHSIHNL